MDLVHYQCVGRHYVSVLEPAARDPRRYDDHVPARRLRRGFTLAIDHADLESVGAENGLGYGTNRESLPRACAGDNSEPFARRREIADLGAVLFLQDGLNPQAERQLDCLTGCASG